MGDVARYNPEAGLLQVRFASGARNTYQYSNIDQTTWDRYIGGRLGVGGSWPTYIPTMRVWRGVKI
jgi:hypothetical protein